ncbi:MAG TPA: hypothetical protein VK694_02910 [Verrucomicrobiae bacterium]|nr:hypothetical protein [Verrucomicrobiae bacterium]
MTAELAETGKNFITLAQAKRSRSIGAYRDELEAHGRLTDVVAESVDKAVAVRAGNRLLWYLAGPLTGMDEPTKRRYVDLSELIAIHDSPVSMFGYAPHAHGTDPIKHPDVTPAEVRDIDYLWSTVVADGHFNCLHPMGHGNAIEEGWAEEAGIPSVYLVPQDMQLSRLVLGMRNVVGTVRYDSFEADGLAQVDTLLEGISAQYTQAFDQ